jgi:hypothetical protein
VASCCDCSVEPSGSCATELVLQADAEILPEFRPRPLPVTSFHVLHSLTILPSDAVVNKRVIK